MVAAINQFNPYPPSCNDVLECLGVRDHFSAVSALTDILWAEDLLVAHFMEAALKVRPRLDLFFTKWDLHLVL